MGGKTTLFRMLVGEETPDEGAVSVPKKLSLGFENGTRIKHHPQTAYFSIAT
jgi:ABC-type Mn2+/Zn2+ transport system ATPase subunit